MQPVSWAEVPGNNIYGIGNFLVMKYEAKCAKVKNQEIGPIPIILRVYSL